MSERPPVTIVHDPWAPVPEQLLYDTTVSDSAVRVYGALMRHGGWNGTLCYPSRQRLARLTGKSLSTVKRALAELAEAGWIVIHNNFNEDRQQFDNNSYDVLTVKGVTSDPSGFTDAPSPRVMDEQGVGSPESQQRESFKESPLKTLSERVSASARKPSDCDEQFSEWYSHYPRKAKRADAAKAFAKALTKVDAESLILAAKRYASDPNLPEPRFVPYPATWLNGECWDDGPLPSRHAKNAHVDVSDKYRRGVEAYR